MSGLETRKRALSSHKAALRTIVAFVNAAGGTLLIGVENGAGAVRGVTTPLDLAEAVANLISDAVAPASLVFIRFDGQVGA